MSVTYKASNRRAVRVRVTGVVQGVGFRPFVYRLAREYGVAGWVLNGEDGVHVAAEAEEVALARFIEEMRERPPSAACIASFEISNAALESLDTFEIRESIGAQTP